METAHDGVPCLLLEVARLYPRVLAEVLHECSIDEYEESAKTAGFMRKVESDSLDCADGQMMVKGGPTCWATPDIWDAYENNPGLARLLASISYDVGFGLLGLAGRVGTCLHATWRFLLPRVSELCGKGYQAITRNGRLAPSAALVARATECAAVLSKGARKCSAAVFSSPLSVAGRPAAGGGRASIGDGGEGPLSDAGGGVQKVLMTQKGTWRLKEGT
eukprot:2256363-Prymnesium_polylepis.1